MSAALMMSSEGITSNTSCPTSMVRHSDSPQTEQHGLLATLAPSHSSRGFPAIHTRFDWEGSAVNESLSISLVSRVIPICKGWSTFSSVATACCRPCCVAPHRSQVRPSESSSRCQTIGNDFIVDFLPSQIRLSGESRLGSGLELATWKIGAGAGERRRSRCLPFATFIVGGRGRGRRRVGPDGSEITSRSGASQSFHCRPSGAGLAEN